MIRLVPPLTVLLLGTVLAYQWSDWPPPLASKDTPGAADPEGGNGQGQGDPLAGLGPHEPKEAYASVTERPLFRPQRKPPDAVAGAGPSLDPQAAVDLTGVDLSAVVISPSVVSAWVRDNQAQGLRRVRLGDELEGWAVKDILGDRVVLERQGERNELLLRDFSQVPPPATPPPRARPTPAAQRMPQRLVPRPPLQRHSPQGQEPGVIVGEPAEPDESTPDGSNP